MSRLGTNQHMQESSGKRQQVLRQHGEDEEEVEEEGAEEKESGRVRSVKNKEEAMSKQPVGLEGDIALNESQAVGKRATSPQALSHRDTECEQGEEQRQEEEQGEQQQQDVSDPRTTPVAGAVGTLNEALGSGEADVRGDMATSKQPLPYAEEAEEGDQPSSAPVIDGDKNQTGNGDPAHVDGMDVDEQQPTASSDEDPSRGNDGEQDGEGEGMANDEPVDGAQDGEGEGMANDEPVDGAQDGEDNDGLVVGEQDGEDDGMVVDKERENVGLEEDEQESSQSEEDEEDKKKAAKKRARERRKEERRNQREADKAERRKEKQRQKEDKEREHRVAMEKKAAGRLYRQEMAKNARNDRKKGKGKGKGKEVTKSKKPSLPPNRGIIHLLPGVCIIFDKLFGVGG